MSIKSNKRRFRRKWMLVLILIITFSAAGCAKSNTSSEGAAANQPKQTEVKVTEVVKRSIGDPYEVVAKVAPSIEREIVSNVQGDVIKVAKSRGDWVEKGEVLFQIDPANALAQKRKADLSLKTAEADLSKMQKELEKSINDQEIQLNKLKNDYDDGTIDEEQVVEADKKLNQMKEEKELSLARLNEQVEVAKITLQDSEKIQREHKFIAPISGILTELDIELGKPVTQGLKVGTIQQIETVKILADVSEQEIEMVREKETLSFYLSSKPEQLMKGKIIYAADIMNPQTRAFALELETEEKAIKPGAKVHLQLTNTEEQNVLTIPTTSIIREENNTFVYVHMNGIAEKRQIKLGRLNDMYQEVLSGLNAGEQIITSGLSQLKDKQSVTIMKAGEKNNGQTNK